MLGRQRERQVSPRHDGEQTVDRKTARMTRIGTSTRRRRREASVLFSSLYVLLLSFCFCASDVSTAMGSDSTEDTRASSGSSSPVALHRKLAEDPSAEKKVIDDPAFEKLLKSHNDLLKHSDDEIVKVLGPTFFPKPTQIAEETTGTKRTNQIVPYLKPALGTHRPEKDAVVAYASEYQLQNYVVFVDSLRRTGFDGDIVLSVTEGDLKKSEIRDYLSNAEGVVVYTPEHVCYNFEGEVVDSAKGGMRTCQIDRLWGRKDADGKVTAIDDPRPQRTLATARYEIYWLILLNYNPRSWILVVDARDTYFQANPFTDVPRDTDPSGQSGLLYYFGENIEATRLGLSPQNSKWLNSAYGDKVATALKDKPTICSGASMGEQIAMESYARAMVSEYDETGTVLMGADQGFHNFMYYSQKLKNSLRVHDIVVFDQGTGIVNNMGA